MSNQIQEMLQEHDLRLTRIRSQVLELFLSQQKALSQSELEERLGKVDRITLYRTLRTFEEKGLIHRAIDGTEKLKFALCSHHCSAEEHQDHHAHLHCERCGKTICAEHIQPPSFKTVEGFEIRETYLVIRGICAECMAREAEAV